MDDAPKHGSMEDSPREPLFEQVDIKEVYAAEKLAAQRARMDKARAKRDAGIPGGTIQDHSFYTKGDKGVGTTSYYENAKSEQGWHRLLSFMKARGLSNKECAEKLGKTEATISQVSRAPWFREQLEAVIMEEGRDSLREVLNGEVLNSVYTLIDVRDDVAAKGSERIAAASALIDRVLGKAPQTIQHVDGGRSEAAKEQTRIDADLALVEAELNALGANGPQTAKLGEADFVSVPILADADSTQSINAETSHIP